MLDACTFGVLKTKYSSIREDKSFWSPFTRKLMRIKCAFSFSITQEVIHVSWEKEWFELLLKEGLVSSCAFNNEFKDHIREQVSHQTSFSFNNNCIVFFYILLHQFYYFT